MDFAREALSLSGNAGSTFGIGQCRLRFCYLTQKPKAFSGISFHLPVRGRDQCRGAQRPEKCHQFGTTGDPVERDTGEDAQDPTRG